MAGTSLTNYACIYSKSDTYQNIFSRTVFFFRHYSTIGFRSEELRILNLSVLTSKTSEEELGGDNVVSNISHQLLSTCMLISVPFFIVPLWILLFKYQQM